MLTHNKRSKLSLVYQLKKLDGAIQLRIFEEHNGKEFMLVNRFEIDKIEGNFIVLYKYNSSNDCRCINYLLNKKVIEPLTIQTNIPDYKLTSNVLIELL